MDQDPKVAPRGQGPPNFPHKRGTEKHLNPEVGSLQAAPAGGRENPNTSTTGKYCGKTPGRRGYCSSSAENMDGAGGRTIGHKERALEGMDKVGNQG